MPLILNNLAVEYQDQGTGPAILLLHGWKDSLHTFDKPIPFLTKHWRIIRVDLPGFGGSEVPRESWNVGDYVQFVKDFCDKLNIQPEVIIGHSLGGRIAIKGVATRKLAPKKLILIASAGVAETRTFRNYVFYLLAKIGKVVSFIPPFVFWRTQLRKKLYLAAKSDYADSGVLKNTFLNIIREDLSAYASQISIPTLLVWGVEDTATPLAEGKRLVQLIKNSQLVVLDGAGHFVHQEKPDRVFEMINTFITSR